MLTPVIHLNISRFSTVLNLLTKRCIDVIDTSNDMKTIDFCKKAEDCLSLEYN